MTPSLSQFCQGGLAGTLRLEYAYHADVDPDSLYTIVSPQWNRPYDVIFLEGDWQTLPVLRVPRWQETMSSNSQGNVYTHQVIAQVRQLSAGASAVFDAISRRRLLLRITDYEGRTFITGNREQAFRLAYVRQAGGNGQYGGYRVTITGQTSHSTTAYNPFV
ncbi:MAG: hypothetical protein AAF828_01560 [Bacteroidota bacterium]